jgi:uncharacterized membrane protein YbhN (UPF0104 family)
MRFKRPNWAFSGWRRPAVLWWSAVATVVLAGFLVARGLEPAAVRATLFAARSDPLVGGAVLALYGGAFALRAGAWSRLVPELPFRHALAALHVSLAANHVLPFRLGEALRVTTAVQRTPVSFAAATASTVTLRSGDMLAVGALAAVLGPRVIGTVVGGRVWFLLGPAALLFVLGAVWLRRLGANRPRASLLLVGVVAAVAWVLESAVLWRAAGWAGLEVSFIEAVLVTAVTIAAQAVAIAPAGLGTYEAAATASLVLLGAGAAPALAAALVAHALKTAYALVTGTVATFWPAPGALGRLRLPRPPARRAGHEEGPGTQPACLTRSGRAHPALPGRSGRAHLALPGRSGRAHPASGPVVFFFPARDEEPSVADVVRRVPSTVLGRRVETMVVDDGSRDGTSAAAAGSGAAVISLGSPSGLGAAVRTGLREATARGAAAVAFCDADGEYRPEELERVVAPILAGTADYVVGTRRPSRRSREVAMRPHRRAGNVFLSWVLSFIARTPIGDGQSGYRALSAAAAGDANIVHDFNYAQVLTLDLLAKGYRYAEVPISYRYRATGRSFVRLAAYLGAVAPAVHRELNDVPP